MGNRIVRLGGTVALLALLQGCTGQIGASDAEAPNAGERLPPPPPGPPMVPPPVVPPVVEPPPFVPLANLVRRLSRDEYVYTVADVVGVQLTPSEVSTLPVDRPLAGFSRTASGQTILPDHVLGYAALAEQIVGKPDFAGFVAGHTSCRTLDRSCGEAFARSAGRSLFRRPLTEAEVAAYAELFVAVAAASDFDRSVRAVAQAMLQSPTFLYLLEDESSGAERTVTGYELASRLSYALWSSAPDAPLLAAAEAGELDAVEGVVAQATRMLADTERIRRGRRRFIVDWGRLESLPDGDGLRAELIEAVRRFYTDYVEIDGSLFDILTVPQAYLTPALAANWGVPSTGDGVRVYDTSGLPGRRGLLAQPGLVAGMTNADGGAIVARGLFLQAQLFCSEPPDPPASLQTIIEEFVAEIPEGASERAIADVRLGRSGCAGCHGQFDPLAFGFEHFDYRGRYRTEDEHGNPVVVDGWIPGALIAGPDQDASTVEDRPYADFARYMTDLAAMTQVRRCLVQRQLEYLVGRRFGRDQEAAVRALTEAAAAEGGRLEALIIAAVAHPVFRTAAPEGD